MTKEQEAIEKLTNGEKIDFNTLIRKFKKEGIENFVVTKKEYIETVLSMLKEKDKEIENKDKIIDLMELYDHVNGMIVFDIITYDNGEKAIKIPSGYLISENEIQNILTHEQYMQNCYKCQDIENGTI